jgi:hypothetical protein
MMEVRGFLQIHRSSRKSIILEEEILVVNKLLAFLA